MSWAIRHDGSEYLAGWPEPLVFATRKEAHARKCKIASQDHTSLELVEVDMPVNCKEKIKKFRRGKRAGK